MFVKIIRPEIEKLWECEGVKISHVESPAKGEPRSLLVELEPTGPTFSIQEKAPNQVFVMNNDGRTIDRYHWHGEVNPA